MSRSERAIWLVVPALTLVVSHVDAGCNTTLSECVAICDADSSFAYITTDWVVQPIELSGGDVCRIELPLWAGSFGDAPQTITLGLQTSPIPGVGVLASGMATVGTRETVSVSMSIQLPERRARYYLSLAGDGDRSPLWKRGSNCDDTGALFMGEDQPWNLAYRVVGVDLVPVVPVTWSLIKAMHGHASTERVGPVRRKGTR